MNAIRSKLYFFAVASVLAGGFSALSILRPWMVKAAGNAPIISVILLVIAACAAGLAFRERRKEKAAQLIMDNQILHINAAEILEGGAGSCESGGDMEAFISCFGILLNGKIIKFNQKGIQLKSVEIDRDHIFLTYGNSKRARKIRLLHEKMDDEKMMNIVERFHYETGISPIIVENKEEKERI